MVISFRALTMGTTVNSIDRAEMEPNWAFVAGAGGALMAVTDALAGLFVAGGEVASVGPKEIEILLRAGRNRRIVSEVEVRGGHAGLKLVAYLCCVHYGRGQRWLTLEFRHRESPIALYLLACC